MKILAVGDIVGENGLKKAKEVIPNLKKEKNIDFIIMNRRKFCRRHGNYRTII